MSKSKLSQVVVLGSTGSVGTQTLHVLQKNPQLFSVYALAAKSNVDLLFEQCQTFCPQYAVLEDASSAIRLQQQLRDSGSRTEIFAGSSAVRQLAEDSAVDIVVAAIVGAAGLPATFAAAKMGKRILLANKEALVMAGDLFMTTVKQSHAELLPVDSEHNAIFQALPTGYLPGQSVPEGVHSVVLTASGGPFLQYPIAQFPQISPSQAVAHPNWAMGAKISVDSATMMNKVLEVIEARYLFSLPEDKIDVVIHPQSIVHSMVRYHDGSAVAQMGVPDMRTPIAHCLGWPKRIQSDVPALDLRNHVNLSFESVDLERFPCFSFGHQVLRAGQSAITTLNAANEVAVEAFLVGRLRYTDIALLIDAVLQQHILQPVLSIDAVLDVDLKARQQAEIALNQASFCR